MSPEPNPIERLRSALDARADAARARRAHPAAARFWQVLLGRDRWLPAEEAHVASCADCRELEDRIRAEVGPAALLLAEVAPEPSVEPIDDPRTADFWVIGAATADRDEALYDAVQIAARDGSTSLAVRLDDGTMVPLFKILHDEKLIAPCFIEGRTVVVERPNLGRQEVTPFGGVVIPWDDLRTVRVHVHENGRLIEIVG